MDHRHKYSCHRGASGNLQHDYSIPSYLRDLLPASRSASILDIGCGFGRFLQAVKLEGYPNISGLDIDDDAIEYCRTLGIPVSRANDGIPAAIGHERRKYQLITMSHVLEHLPKDEVIPTLQAVRRALTDEGYLFIAVPNAQSNTGPYWAYEDWTHHTLFTSGAMRYVLDAAGFQDIEFLDVKGVSHISSPAKRVLKLSLLRLYESRVRFWNWVTTSSFHAASPSIYSYELKVSARP